MHAVHSDCRAVSVYVPGAQAELLTEPVAHEAPTGQSVQAEGAASPALLEYVPARHGSSAEAPSGQKLPALQTLHTVDPLESWKLPAAHAVHSGWRAMAVYVPGAHGEWAVEPVAQALPTGHAVQSLDLVRFATFEYEPAAQGSSADAPSGQKLPPLQGMHITAPS